MCGFLIGAIGALVLLALVVIDEAWKHPGITLFFLAVPVVVPILLAIVAKIFLVTKPFKNIVKDEWDRGKFCQILGVVLGVLIGLGFAIFGFSSLYRLPVSDPLWVQMELPDLLELMGLFGFIGGFVGWAFGLFSGPALEIIGEWLEWF